MTGEESVGVDLAELKILRGDADGVCLDASVDVFGNEYCLFAGFSERAGNADDAVVGGIL